MWVPTFGWVFHQLQAVQTLLVSGTSWAAGKGRTFILLQPKSRAPAVGSPLWHHFKPNWQWGQEEAALSIAAPSLQGRVPGRGIPWQLFPPLPAPSSCVRGFLPPHQKWYIRSALLQASSQRTEGPTER